MAYCETTDLLTGNIPTPSYLSPQKYVNDAADEIDSKIGFIYQTPVSTNTAPRPVGLLLKRLNVFIATGRLLMAVDAAGEDDQIHAYGFSLVKDATLTLEAIASGKIELDEVPRVPVSQASVTAPLIYNKDEESNVEAFYDRIANPDYIFPTYGPRTGLVP